MKKFLAALLAVLMIISLLPVTALAATEATLSFANKNQRTSFSTSKQVWQQNGITFTNNKAASTSNVADYAGPVRLYASSELIIEYPGMTKIEFTCSSSSYATALKNSISGSTVSGSVVTVNISPAADSFTVAKLSAQVRMSSLKVTAEEQTAPECTHANAVASEAVAATCSTAGYTAGVYCSDCETYIEGHEPVPATGHTMGEWNVNLAPTCTEAGEQNRGCANCDLVETEAIAALGHQYGDGNTCSGCGHVAAMTQYTLVTDASTLKAGDQIILVGLSKKDNSYHGMPGYTSGNNIKSEVINAPVDDVITLPDTSAVAAITLGGDSNGWTLFDGAKYLYAAGSTTNNYLKGIAPLPTNGTGTWTISINASGVATIVSVGKQSTDTDEASNVIKFNYGNTPPLFACYKNSYSTNTEPVFIYKLMACEHEAYESAENAKVVCTDCGEVFDAAAAVVDGASVTNYLTAELALAQRGTGIVRLYADVDTLYAEGDLTLDLNGKNVAQLTVENGKLYGIDTANKGTETFGVIKALNVQPVTDVTLGDRYIALTDENGTSFHYLELKLNGVSIRPSISGLYFNTIVNCDTYLAQRISGYGMVISVKDMPGADFATEDHNLWTTNTGAPTIGKAFTSCSIANIFKTGTADSVNQARGEISVYANAYLNLTSGIVVMMDQTAGDVVTDADFDGAAWSMQKAMQTLASDAVFSKLGDDLTKVLSFYGNWSGVMSNWEIANIRDAYEAAAQ